MYYKDINSEECITLKREAEEFNNTISSELKAVDTVILNYGQEKVLELCRIDDRFKYLSCNIHPATAISLL